MKKRSPRRRNQTRRLDFQELESRQLLAGDLVGPHQVATTLPTGSNMIQNGDFETVVAGDDNFYTADEVAGWSTVDNAPINVFSYQGFDNVLDLDSTEHDFDQVFSNFDAVAGNQYLVTFDFRSHPVFDADATARTHDFEVLFDGTVVGEFSGDDMWQTGSVSVLAESTGSAQLMFREIAEGPNNAGDSQGALLDNIRVVQATHMDIVNGSFEDTAPGVETFFRPWEVDGWGAMGEDVNDRFLKIFRNDQSPNQTQTGNQYLNLDTRAGFTDMVYQNIPTTPGETYFIAFDYRTDGVQSEDPTVRDETRVQLKDVWATTILGDGNWSTAGLFVTADADFTRLTFREPGDANGGDGSGALIDNVRVYQVQTNSVTLDLDPSSEGTGGATTYVPTVGAQTIASSAVLTNDATGKLSSVTISLGGAADGVNEKLAVSPANIPNDSNIIINEYNPSTQQLVLSGEAPVEDYQNVLRSLVYFNGLTDMATTNRTVTITATDASRPVGTGTAETTVDISVETNQDNIDDAIIQKLIADNGFNATEVSPGLFMQINTPGTGVNPTINSTVRVAYTGKFVELNDNNQMVEGTTFETSSEEGATFPLSNVIRGWQLGIPELKTGGTAKLLIPSRLGYGPNGSFSGTIPGDTVLVFDVDLKQIFS